MNNKIEKAFSDFNSQTHLVIGDVMIDSYMWGKVDRISPEAPVPVISVSKRENRLGGAANVALNVKALGANVVMCALIGDDSKGKVFKTLLKKSELTDAGILVSKDRKTTIKTRIISDNQHLLRVDDEETHPISTEQEELFKHHINSLFSSYSFDVVIFEDYDKGNITPAIIDFVVKKSNLLKIPTLVDPKKRNFADYKNVTLFKPNFKEICEGVKMEIPKGDFAALFDATQKLNSRLNAKYIMVTLSELGVFITENGKYRQIPAHIRDIADVSGAGDTVISVAACCLAAGLSAEKVAAISNIAGGQVCEKVGVVPIEKSALEQEAINFFLE